METPTPKVSVIVPVYNAEKYLRECLNSIITQTLREIEIICVNDGSKDSSLKILEEYAQKDSRIKIISKCNSGYGHTMNMGLRLCQGDYIGIVESDDYILPQMYSKLYELAVKNRADFVKGDFSRFEGEGASRKFFRNYLTTKENYNRVFNMRETLLPFRFYMLTCSGIYHRKFLLENKICWNESPGASYQDNGFWFFSFCYAKNVYFTDQSYYMYRADNAQSSIRRKDRVFAMNDEYAFIKRKIRSSLSLWRRVRAQFEFAKLRNYLFTFSRIEESMEKEFVAVISEEFKADIEEDEGVTKDELIQEWEGRMILTIIKDPETFLKKRSQEKNQNKETSYSPAPYRGRPRWCPIFLIRFAAIFIPSKSSRKRFRKKFIESKK